MKRLIPSVAVFLILLAGVSPVQAQTNVDVDTFGIELCPQSVCGAAIFVGVLSGQVGLNPHAFGAFAAAFTHEDLPEPTDPPALLTGGVFELKVGWRRIRGFVHSGTIANNNDGTFDVNALLVITSGGSGCLAYTGELNHNVFPPTVAGPLVTTACPI